MDIFALFKAPRRQGVAPEAPGPGGTATHDVDALDGAGEQPTLEPLTDLQQVDFL